MGSTSSNEPRHVLAEGARPVGGPHGEVTPQNLPLVAGVSKLADYGLAGARERLTPRDLLRGLGPKATALIAPLRDRLAEVTDPEASDLLSTVIEALEKQAPQEQPTAGKESAATA
jgi:hypothetical protein